MFYTYRLWNPGFREASVCLTFGAEEDVGGMYGAQGWWPHCPLVLGFVSQVCGETQAITIIFASFLTFTHAHTHSHTLLGNKWL